MTFARCTRRIGTARTCSGSRWAAPCTSLTSWPCELAMRRMKMKQTLWAAALLRLATPCSTLLLKSLPKFLTWARLPTTLRLLDRPPHKSPRTLYYTMYLHCEPNNTGFPVWLYYHTTRHMRLVYPLSYPCTWEIYRKLACYTHVHCGRVRA